MNPTEETPMINPIKASEKPLRVLTPELTFRLRCATGAIHKLRALGYKVASQDLHLGASRRPLLNLVAGGESLRQQCTQITIEQRERYRIIIARFAGCDVRWQQDFEAVPPFAHGLNLFAGATS